MQKKKKMIEERIKELLRNLWTYDKTARIANLSNLVIGLLPAFS
jgi:hypothetical protein